MRFQAKFLRLLDAGETDSLTPAEQAELLQISDCVDFREFSIVCSAPRYMEGTLRGRNNGTLMEWHDGTREVLDPEVSRALSEVNPGERFAAFVKLGRGDRPLWIERVVLLKDPPANRDWETWPKKA